MTARGGRSSLGLRPRNRLRVLEALYRHPASSRGELRRRTGLSRATVSALVDELVRGGVVAETDDSAEDAPGIASRSAGRPPGRLSLVAGAGFAVGLDLGHQHIRVAVVDLAGHPVVDEWSAAEVDHAPLENLDLAAELVSSGLREAGVDAAEVLGVGMGVAAPIDRRTGRLRAGPILPGWDGIEPAAEMERRLGLAVELDNDANLGALGERAFGAGRGSEDFAYIRLSAGIGAGLILGGRPYHGAGGVAGEIGHVLSDPAGPVCRCGNRGCLEAVAGPVAVAAQVARGAGRPVTVADLLALAAGGDRGAREAIAGAGEAVGRAISTLVNLLNPELVVVGGDLAQTGAVLLDPIAVAIARHSVAPAAGAVTVCAGTLGARAEVLGAAALVLARSPRALAERIAVS